MVESDRGSQFRSAKFVDANRRTWANPEEFRIAIVTWIERTCQRCRRHAALGRLTLSPVRAADSAPSAAVKCDEDGLGCLCER